jgi:hypothetical protein
MAPFLGADVKYAGRDAHVTQVVGYLLRATRVKYCLTDLLAVCRFLSLIEAKRDLYRKFVERGKKLFPSAPQFHVMAGGIEVEKGPFTGGSLWRARDCFERALALAERSKDPQDAALVAAIQQQLSMIKDLTSGIGGMPIGGFGGGPLPFSGEHPSLSEIVDAIERGIGGDWYDDEEDDEFDDDEGLPLDVPMFGRYSIPRSQPKPKPKSRPRSKTQPTPKPKPRPKKG